jgi:peptidoglycan/LPS O-acetylase OafA/YrhL
MFIIVYLSVQFLNLDPFVFDFALGILVAHMPHTFLIKKTYSTWLLIAGILILTVSYLFPVTMHAADVLFIHHNSLALTAFLIVIICSKKIQEILSFRPFLLLGKISYSFYLFHLIILYALMPFAEFLAPFLFFLVVLATTIIVSIIVYKRIEVPFMKIALFSKT